MLLKLILCLTPLVTLITAVIFFLKIDERGYNFKTVGCCVAMMATGFLLVLQPVLLVP